MKLKEDLQVILTLFMSFNDFKHAGLKYSYASRPIDEMLIIKCFSPNEIVDRIHNNLHIKLQGLEQTVSLKNKGLT